MNSQWVIKDGSLNAGLSSWTIRCKQGNMIHMGELLSVAKGGALNIGYDSPDFSPAPAVTICSHDHSCLRKTSDSPPPFRPAAARTGQRGRYGCASACTLASPCRTP